MRRLTNSHCPAIKNECQKRAEAIIQGNLKQLHNGQYQTSLLWKTDRRPHNNYEAAKAAFLRFERSLEEDELVKKSFHYNMTNWIDSFYLENTVNDNTVTAQNFLTTFIVMKDGEPLEKGRLVVNGARKFKGESLNCFLEPGANVMNDLSELLLRIRRHKHVMCCDLAQMFLNIKVSPEDRQYLRVFYRADPAQDLKVYQFTVHAFGLSSSPCVAMSVVRHHAKINADKWPIAEEAIRLNSLVDDIWFMSDNLADLYEGKKEIKHLMESMGVGVHKWGSNCAELLSDIPEEKKAKMVKLTDEDRTAIKALGMVWDTERDTFLYAKTPPDLAPWTLRSMTSSAGQLFDPTVLVGPTTLPAKLLIQSAWRYQPGWDDPLPDCLAEKNELILQKPKAGCWTSRFPVTWEGSQVGAAWLSLLIPVT